MDVPTVGALAISFEEVRPTCPMGVRQKSSGGGLTNPSGGCLAIPSGRGVAEL